MQRPVTAPGGANPLSGLQREWVTPGRRAAGRLLRANSRAKWDETGTNGCRASSRNLVRNCHHATIPKAASVNIPSPNHNPTLNHHFGSGCELRLLMDITTTIIAIYRAHG